MTAMDPSAAEPVELPQVSYDGEQLVADIKALLIERGSFSIRGLGRVFKILDDNKNKQLDAEELSNGLMTYGINLNDEQIAALVAHFDRDGNKTVSFDEFLRAIRVSYNSIDR